MTKTLLTILGLLCVEAYAIWHIRKALRERPAFRSGKIARVFDVAAHWFGIAALAFSGIFVACGIVYFVATLFVQL